MVRRPVRAPRKQPAAPVTCPRATAAYQLGLLDLSGRDTRVVPITFLGAVACRAPRKRPATPVTCPRDPPILFGLSDAPTMATDFGSSAARSVSRGVVLTSFVLLSRWARRDGNDVLPKSVQSVSPAFSKHGMSRPPNSIKRA